MAATGCRPTSSSSTSALVDRLPPAGAGGRAGRQQGCWARPSYVQACSSPAGVQPASNLWHAGPQARRRAPADQQRPTFAAAGCWRRRQLQRLEQHLGHVLGRGELELDAGRQLRLRGGAGQGRGRRRASAAEPRSAAHGPGAAPAHQYCTQCGANLSPLPTRRSSCLMRFCSGSFCAESAPTSTVTPAASMAASTRTSGISRSRSAPCRPSNSSSTCVRGGRGTHPVAAGAARCRQRVVSCDSYILTRTLAQAKGALSKASAP
jgi:hypothetical protein